MDRRKWEWTQGAGNGHKELGVDMRRWEQTRRTGSGLRRQEWTLGGGSGHGGTGSRPVQKATRTAPRGDFKVSDFRCVPEPCTILPHSDDKRQHQRWQAEPGSICKVTLRILLVNAVLKTVSLCCTSTLTWRNYLSTQLCKHLRKCPDKEQLCSFSFSSHLSEALEERCCPHPATVNHSNKNPN